ncbi:neutral ceramidase precursor [Moniliophthora roreri MCA 2997]|uniref:Neutral ceramidase n=2 Tax=Moniliophthora roreri TaxID=221103 RepID=V2XB56_MONRO|nr:neutral ceramidase precursor [Moniliophthora roreri MCA 2997]
MPLLAYHDTLPVNFWEFVRGLFDSMTGFVWYLTAFLASGSLFHQNGAVMGVAGQEYLLGLGIGDITGPVVETNMMGYAALSQTDTGLHMRQRSRAFIIAEAANSNNRIVFINADIAMGDTGVRRSIVQQLSSQFPGVYTNENIAFVGTHQHAGVGGYLENLLPQITALGYVKQTADAIVQGTVLAVRRAHDNLAPGKLSLGNTTILDANINRSPSAYLANPAEERARYQYDQDKGMSLLRFDDANGKARGLLSFFAVHGTSLYENNTLVSTDNKGMAAFLYEASVEPSAMPGNSSFVAGFTQANVGDTSPNTLGAFCESPGKPYDGMPCTFNQSTCGGTAQDCHGRGPGFRISDFESNRLIGQAQFQGAQTIMNGNLSPVSGAVRSVHVYMNMANHTFTLPNGTTARTCPAALGFSFAGGTTDGPGAFDFVQGDNSSQPQNPFWEIVKGVVTPFPSAEQKACQDPKPILLNSGYAHTPYEWSPSTVDIQILRAGNFVMLIMPGELTTMAGRRIRESIRAKLISSGIIGSNAYVVVAGPANTYGHYVTTREEYGVQRYEGASTIFGQYTLEAYIDKYSSLLPFIANNRASGNPTSDAAPAEQTSKAISLQTPVILDNPPIGKKFGDVLTDVRTSSPYRVGETVNVQFVGANPRSNLRLEGTFLSVEQQVSGQWKAVRSDSHPSTIYRWSRTSTILGTSTVNISWTIESGTPAGSYRIHYFGDSKPLIGSITPFTGTSSVFTLSS